MQPSAIEIELEKLTYGGDALGRLPDGRAVFVPYGVPGERVRVRIVEEKKNFARAELIEILEPSPQRIQPRCRHHFVPQRMDEKEGPGVQACGGCHYQHIPYEVQLAAKADILRDQLQRIGMIENPPVQPAVACPEAWHYRNHVQFHLTGEGKLGFVGTSLSPASAVIPITECHLPEPAIRSLWPQLDFDPGMSIGRVSLRAGTGGDLMLILEADDLAPPELELEAGISVVHLLEEDALVMAGDDHLTLSVLGRDFHVSPASFFQVNTLMAEKMVEHVLRLLPQKMEILVDVYCGVGLFSAFLAPRCERLVGIEASPSACEDFAINLDEFDQVELYEAPAEQVLPALAGEIPQQSFVLVDPPRSGLDKHALDGLVRMWPQTIVYVSCDPSTLARDAKRLVAAGYILDEVTPFDLFPQTYHIESISLFSR